MTRIQPPYYPIIFVRGFAGTQGAIEDTVATPYMGFNLGSTKLRQAYDGQLRKYVFESPLIRLMKDHGYRDTYDSGAMTSTRIDSRSIVIFRYYDSSSRSFGDGVAPSIEDHARELGALIERVRDQVCGNSQLQRSKFKVVLVAHSMGGLICRCLLQNPQVGDPRTRKLVDKVFTYATPHNGIDLEWIGNVPSWLTRNSIDNFNRLRMQEYLGLEGGESAHSLGGRFDPDRFFCLVGTDARDYDVAGGWSRRGAGPLSDGLVRIENAVTRNSPRAFVHRSHSGEYGIVNSEEGYQNLVRFLFGDHRVDGRLLVHSITLPRPLQAKAARGRSVRAAYDFETVVRVRGARWDLHRRLATEFSAIRRTSDDLDGADANTRRHPYLFSVFLSRGKWARSKQRGSEVAFQVDLGLRAPEYEVDRRFWRDEHFEGAFLYRDTLHLQYIPARKARESWTIDYGFSSEGLGTLPHRATPMTLPDDGGILVKIPIRQPNDPALEAELQLQIRPWNQDL